MNLDGLSSSLYQGLIPPSRIGNITTGAWKHTHTNTELTFFFPREGKSCLVEHTKIGEVWGNSKKTWWERWCGDVGTWRRLGEKIQMNLCPKMSWRLVIYQHKRPFRNAPFWMLYLSNLGLLLVFMLLWRQACPLKSAIFRNVPKYSYIHTENVCALSQVVAMLATSWPQLVKMLASYAVITAISKWAGAADRSLILYYNLGLPPLPFPSFSCSLFSPGIDVFVWINPRK